MPAYNAGKTIEKVFSRIPAEIHKKIHSYVVVNDGSNDDTEDALNRLKKKYNNLVVIKHQTNMGYGAAEKSLLNFALKEKADIAVLLHSDGQYAPELLPDLLKPFAEEKADIVQGSRMLGGGALQGGDGAPQKGEVPAAVAAALEVRLDGRSLLARHLFLEVGREQVPYLPAVLHGSVPASAAAAFRPLASPASVSRPRSLSRSSARPRWSRDLTVPTAIPRISLTSS